MPIQAFGPAPARMQRIGNRVYVGLLNMSDDFTRLGPGRMAVIDTDRDIVVDVWEIPGGKNCFKPATAWSHRQSRVNLYR